MFSRLHIGTNEGLTGEEVLCGLCTTTSTCPISTYPSNTSDTSTTDDGKSLIYLEYRIVNALNGRLCKKTVLIFITIQ